VVILRRAPVPVARQVRLDASQQAALDSDARVLRVLGSPGTGKTTLAVELVADAVRRRGLCADHCLLLTASRSAAAELRQRVTARLAGTTTEPLARTWQAFGFGVLRAEAALHGDPSPRLLNGPEQDVILRDLLAGHASGEVSGPDWPDALREALGTRGFRNELRDLLMRAVEHGQGPDDLHRLGVEHDRPEWVAAAHVLREYDQVTSFSRHGSYDPAWVLTAVAERLEDDPDALDRLHARLDLVVVDEAQEVTAAAVRLLRVVAGAGPRVVLLGDPDVAVQSFRGADPRFLAHGWEALADAPRHRRRPPTPSSSSTATGWGRPSTPSLSVSRGASGRSAVATSAATSPTRRAVTSASPWPCCARPPRRRATSAACCDGPTSSRACRGPTWPSSSAARVGPTRCAAPWPRPACPSPRAPPRPLSATRAPCGRCSRSSRRASRWPAPRSS